MPQNNVVAKAPAGDFQGVRLDGICVFRGIRYGVAGATRRFQAPLPVARISGVIKAWTNGPVCPQRGPTDDPQNEDCLCLNLWTPDCQRQAQRPVMVYLHGGGFSSGGNSPLTDGAFLAAHGDVVVVGITHRLNALGYLSLARVDPRFPDSGNVGQLDLVLALTWLRNNVAAFGGDPNNVTLFGTSGGGGKIVTLMAMPAAQGLFHKAATMSGQQITVTGALHAEQRARAYLARLDMDAVNAPIQRLTAALDAADPLMDNTLVYFGPVLDTRSLLRHPFFPDAHPQSLAIPMLMGSTLAETRTFYPPTNPKMLGLDWNNIADRIAPELRVDLLPEWVIEKYREWFPNKSPAEIFIAATTAGRNLCSLIMEAEARAKGGAPAYVYQLDFEQTAHGKDIGLIFGTKPDMSAAQRAMSERLMDSLVAFAKTGAPGWPAYELPARTTMIFDNISRVENDPRGRERELFASVPYIQPGT